MTRKKAWQQLLLVFLVLTALMLACSGCLNSRDEEQDNLPYLGERQGEAGGPAAAGPGVYVEPLDEPGERIQVVLYFIGGDGHLVAETRQIPKVQGLARRTMEELCRGPAQAGLLPTLPAGTALRDINIRDGLATVDFSGELVAKHGGGSSGELLTVYSIVNTLTQFQTVERVQILVEGRQVESLAGHVDVREPLTRDGHLVRSSGIS